MPSAPAVTLPDAPPVPRPRRLGWPVWWKRLWFVVALALVVLVVGNQLYGRWDEHRQREPLRVVERAALEADKPIGVVEPALWDEWSGGTGPTETVVRELVLPGNQYLEPVFYSLPDRDWAPPRTGDRCYYLPVQDGRTFDADAVEGLVQFCYRGQFARPESYSYTRFIR